MEVWNVEEYCGYKPITTFWQDFTVADCFGDTAVRDTYDRAMKGWKSDYKYLTELVMVLNHKCWVHHDKGNKILEKTYLELYEEADAYALDTLKGKELSYFIRTTD
jgi:hypothetical protein